MNTILFFWVIFALTMLSIELVSPGLLYFASFAFGALSAAGTYWMGFHIVAQLIAFLVVSLGAIVILHKMVTYSNNKNDYVSNVHGLIGRQALVVREIKLYKNGAVKINGEQWPASIKSGEPIPIDTLVTVTKISGCHVVVVSEKIKNNTPD